MLDKNLINFKNILKIIISVLIIFSMLKSCANAWTYDQFIDYMEQIATNPNAPQDFRDKALSIYNNSETIRNYIENYNSFYCDTNAGYVDVYATNNTITNASISGTGILQFSRINWKHISYNLNTPNTINNHGETSKNYLNSSYVIGLVELPANIENQLPQAYWLQNKYVQGFEWQPTNTTTVTIGDFTNVQAKKIGQSDGYVLGKIIKFDDRYNYYKVVVFNNQGERIASCQMKRGQDWYWGNDGMVYYYQSNSFDIKARLIYLKQIYTIAIYASDVQINQANTEAKDSQVYTYIFLPENAVITNGAITDYGSGDNYTTQDSTNDQISWWQQTVENIFTLKSGEAREKVENFYNEIGYNSGDVSGELREALAGLDVINGNFGDFVISWNSYNPNLTVKGQTVGNQGNMIPSGEINFSKFERENPAIQEVMKYVRAILSFSIFVMLGKNFWNTLMLTLGISPAVYDKATEESRIAKANEDRSNRK